MIEPTVLTTSSRPPGSDPRRLSASAASPITGAPADATAIISATPAPSMTLRIRPKMIEWRGAPSSRDSQRSITPIAPEVVHSIVATAAASSCGELLRVPRTSRVMSPWTGSGRKRLSWSATSIADSTFFSSSAWIAASPSASGASDSSR